MKTLMCAVFCLVSAAAFADEKAREAATVDWLNRIKANLPDSPNQDADKLTKLVKGTSCNLYISYFSNSFYVVVQDSTRVDSGNDETYIGVSFPSLLYDTKYTLANGSYTMEQQASWGKNGAKFDRVIIDVDQAGMPRHVTGDTDTQHFSCDLK